jgi:uncharacterized protein (DUF433 family)
MTHALQVTAGRRDVRDLLSLKEAVILADVPESDVRKDMERGVLPAPSVVRLSDLRLGVAWQTVITFRLLYSSAALSAELRRMAFRKISASDWTFLCSVRECGHSAVRAGGHEYLLYAASCFEDLPACKLEIDDYLELNVSKAVRSILPRVTVYARGLGRVTERDDTLGGAAVFRGTRLSVSHIGKMVERGETVENILSDYPNLGEEDVKFSLLYHQAHPAVGRPRADRGSSHENAG